MLTTPGPATGTHGALPTAEQHLAGPRVPQIPPVPRPRVLTSRNEGHYVPVDFIFCTFFSIQQVAGSVCMFLCMYVYTYTYTYAYVYIDT